MVKKDPDREYGPKKELQFVERQIREIEMRSLPRLNESLSILKRHRAFLKREVRVEERENELHQEV